MTSVAFAPCSAYAASSVIPSGIVTLPERPLGKARSWVFPALYSAPSSTTKFSFAPEKLKSFTEIHPVNASSARETRLEGNTTVSKAVQSENASSTMVSSSLPSLITTLFSAFCISNACSPIVVTVEGMTTSSKAAPVPVIANARLAMVLSPSGRVSSVRCTLTNASSSIVSRRLMPLSSVSNVTAVKTL